MRSSIRPLIQILFLILLPFWIWGQDPFYINYDTVDGLPSSETYFAYEDVNGLIWIATDRGVCAYDGYQFHTYTTKDGLSHNTNFRIFSDPKDRLWFTAWDGSLSSYENGIFRKYPLQENTDYAEHPGFAIQLLFDQGDNVSIIKNSGNRGEFYLLDVNELSLSKESVFDLKNGVQITGIQDELLFKRGDKYSFYDRNRFSVNMIPLDTAKQSWLAGFNNHSIKHFKGGQLTDFHHKLGLKVGNFFLDPHKNLWICTNDGLLMYEDADLESSPHHFFRGLETTHILMDREGSYWMTSRGKGIYWIPSFAIYSLLRPKGVFETPQVLSIGKLPNHLLFGTVNNGIKAVDKKFDFSRQLDDWQGVLETNKIYPYGNTFYAREFKSIKEINGQLEASPIKQPFNNSGFTKVLGEGLFFITSTGVGASYKVIRADNNVEAISKYSIKNKGETLDIRINCAEQVGEVLWLGTLKGLYYQQIDLIDSLGFKKYTSGYLDTRIEDIICVDPQRFWIATIGNGLIFKNGDRYVQLLQQNGMSSNLINAICLENDSILWVGTNKGLDKINFQNNGSKIKIKNISNFSIADGLISNFINDLTIWEGHLWLATNKGINYFQHKNIVENKIPPLIRIEEVLVEDRAIDITKAEQLMHNENDLVFNFLGLSFKKPEYKTFYRYRLTKDSEESIWYYTNNRSIRFLDLAPGQYKFEVTARNKSDYWSQQTATYSFRIIPHFTDRLWFRILVTLSLFLFIALGLFYRIRVIKNRELQKRKLQSAELSMLRNQMNPHFIFNSLNSIQSFIFQKDIKKANHYLSTFSRLMRNSLEYSRLDYISIYEEINFIHAYLDIEKLRFEDQFEYSIEVSAEIPTHHYYIPPLLLQPILENAIKHAFKDISYQGQLEIRFLTAQREDMIEVVINDNGSGLKENKNESNDSPHQSVGLSIIEDRIKILNLVSEKPKAIFRFSNRYDSNNELIGTQAHFILPIQINSND